MSVYPRPVATDSTPLSLPRVTRRGALLGAASLLLPLSAGRADTATATATAAKPTARPGLILLDGNENPYGPSLASRQAIVASVAESARYADATRTALIEQLAAHEGVAVPQIVLGTGSGELLKMSGILALTASSRRGLIASRPTYEELPRFAEELGMTVRWVAPDAAHRHDLSAMRQAVDDQTALVYICNPNNPTGTAVARSGLDAFVKSIPAEVTIVVDEAYMDFADQPGVESLVGLVNSAPNLIVLRTFSKIHGLAGLRIGYAITAASLAQQFGELSLTWPNTAGLAAATASLNDHAFLKSTRAAIIGDRARVHAALDKLGLSHAEAQGNFVFFDTGLPVKQFQDSMLSQGIKVGRHFDGYDSWARVTIGLRHEVDAFLAALPQALRPT